MQTKLIFIHGLGLGDWVFKEYWLSHFQRLGYECHSLNLPGHTSSASRADKLRVTLDDCVEFVRRFVMTEVAGPCVLVGLSMGGAIVQRLLSDSHVMRKVKGAVLLSSVPPSNNLIFTLRMCKRLALAEPEVLIDFFSDRTNPLLMFSPFMASTVSEAKQQLFLSKVITGLSRLEYELFFQNLLTEPVRSPIPLLVISGEKDLLFPPDVAQFTAAYYDSSAVIMPGVGHLIPLEPNGAETAHFVEKHVQEVFK